LNFVLLQWSPLIGKKKKMRPNNGENKPTRKLNKSWYSRIKIF
jgi:hypothetical protein